MESIFDVIPLEHFVLLSLLLFCIGMAGVLLRRNMIIVFMSIELMLNAVNLLAVAFSSYRGDPGGPVFVFFVIVVAASGVQIFAIDAERGFQRSERTGAVAVERDGETVDDEAGHGGLVVNQS